MVAASQAFSRPLFAWSAFAAFWTCLADPGGPNHIRLRTMGGFAIAGAAVAALASAAAGIGLLVAAPSLFALVFLCGLSRFIDTAVGPAGVLASVVAVVAIDSPNPPEGAAALAGVFLIGAVWAIVLCLLIWRIHPHRPARRAVGAIFRDLGDMAAELRASADRCTVDAGRAPLHTQHRRAVRHTIERARAMVIGVTTGRTDGPVRRRLMAVIEAGDRIFTGLIAIEHDLDARPDRSGAAILSGLLRRLGDVLTEINRQVLRTDPDWARLKLRAKSLARHARAAAGLDARAAEAWVQALADLMAGWTPLLDVPPSPTRAVSQHPKADVVNIRHALRVATVVLAAYLVTAHFSLTYSYWATMAIVMVMQSQAATTWPRVLERVIGSVAGGLAAAILTFLLPLPLELVVVIFPLAAATIAFRSVNYTLFVLFLTPLFVLVAELIAPGHGEVIAFARAFNNVLGGILALAGCLLLWPDPTPESFREKLAKAVEANLAYATLVASPNASLETVETARRQAGINSNAAEATRLRMILEGRRRRAHLDEAAALLAALRRLAGASAVASLAGEDAQGAAAAKRAARYDALRVALGAIVRGQSTDAAPSMETEPEDGIGKAVAHTVEISRLYASVAGRNAARRTA
ncbi:MAG TPA: FUSC family protein [Bradyrhizobium sp.]|nr:FUSC family protein [Bradyrhizobium sp.]